MNACFQQNAFSTSKPLRLYTCDYKHNFAGQLEFCIVMNLVCEIIL